MATNYTNFEYTGSSPRSGAGGVLTLTSEIVDLNGTTTSDTFELFTAPAGAAPLSFALMIEEDAGATCTIHVGLSGDADGCIASADLNQARGTVVTGAGDDLSEDTLASASTYIATTATGTSLTAGKFRVTGVFVCANV